MTERTYRNPLPVAVAVVPVDGGGVLMIRRAIPPVGLAFPGGYIELGVKRITLKKKLPARW